MALAMLEKLRTSYGNSSNTSRPPVYQTIPNTKDKAKGRLRLLKKFDNVRDYGKEFITLLLEVPDTSDKDALFLFIDGLQNLPNLELKRRGIQDLVDAIAVSKSLIDYSTNKDPSKAKDKKGGGVKSGEEQSKGGKWNKDSSSYRHKIRAKKKKTPSQEGGDREDGDTRVVSLQLLNTLQLTLKSQVKNLLFVDATINGKATKTLVDMSASHNFISVEEVRRLGLSVSNRRGPLKAVNSAAHLIHGVAHVRAFPLLFANSMCIMGGEKACVVPTEQSTKEHDNEELEPQGNLPIEVQAVLNEFQDVMSDALPKKLPPRREVDHEIELEPGRRPPAMTPYRMAPPKPSKPPFGALVLFQKKKDGSLRMCIDYRALNK
ncbi:hypothetical protein PanWU01x14_251080, partial [Parasponia andersonii]